MHKGLFYFIALAILLTVIKYAVITAAITFVLCAWGYGIYLLACYLYVGAINNPEADPLCTKVAKYLVSRDSVSVKDICDKFSINTTRSKYIIKQLNQIGLICNDKPVTNSIWELAKYFKLINSNDDFFKKADLEEIIKFKEITKVQIEKEQDILIKSLLETLENTLENTKWIECLENKIGACSSYLPMNILSDIEEELKNRKQVRIPATNLDVAPNILNSYMPFCDMLLSLRSNSKWTMTGCQFSIYPETFLEIKVNNLDFKVPCTNIYGYKLYFYPEFIIKYSYNTYSIKKYHYNDISINYSPTILKKASWFNNNDAHFLYKRYRHTCLDGTPDMRYKNNPSTSYYQFYDLTLTQLNIHILFGNERFPQNITKSFNEFKFLLRNQGIEEHNTYNDICIYENYSSQMSGNLRNRIIDTIKMYKIRPDTIRHRTFVSILKDYRVFLNVEDKAYANIINSAMQDGTLEYILQNGWGSTISTQAISNFITNYGYDENKCKIALSSVIEGFTLLNN